MWTQRSCAAVTGAVVAAVLSSAQGHWACSLVSTGADLGWLVLIFYKRKTLLIGQFGLTEINERTS